MQMNKEMEDKTLGELLKEWNVGATTIAAFEENEISISDLELLSDADLKDPLIGPRNKIKKEISKLRNRDKSVLELSKSQTDMLDENAKEAESENNDKDSDSRCTLDQTDDEDMEADEDEEPQPKQKSKSSHKKSKTTSSYSYDLKSVLVAAGGVGELILNCYKSQGALNDSNRSSLAKIIINSETAGDFNKRVTTERASFLASKIIEMFPSELLSTWYRTEIRSNGRGKIVKGRLMRRFYTQRKSFKKLGVLTNPDSDSDEDENLDEELHGDPGDEATNSVNESYVWLTNRNVSPWTRVVSAGGNS